jgi:hypothetical protein
MGNFMSASKWCQRYKEQNCHECERAECGDNTTPSILELRKQVDELHQIVRENGIDPDLARKNIQLEKKIEILERRNLKVKGDLHQQQGVVRDLMDKNADLAFDLADTKEHLEATRQAIADAVLAFGEDARERVRLKDLVDSVRTADAMRGEESKG